MPVYTVHEPPMRGLPSVPDAERFAFVRDGFYFWAFLFAPLWMLWHRMWLVLVGYSDPRLRSKRCCACSAGRPLIVGSSAC